MQETPILFPTCCHPYFRLPIFPQDPGIRVYHRIFVVFFRILKLDWFVPLQVENKIYYFSKSSLQQWLHRNNVEASANPDIRRIFFHVHGVEVARKAVYFVRQGKLDEAFKEYMESTFYIKDNFPKYEMLKQIQAKVKETFGEAYSKYRAYFYFEALKVDASTREVIENLANEKLPSENFLKEQNIECPNLIELDENNQEYKDLIDLCNKRYRFLQIAQHLVAQHLAANRKKSDDED